MSTTFNKKNQVALVFGELATTYYSSTTATKEMPVILLETNSFDLPKNLNNNFTSFEIDTNGTGADPKVGRELAKLKLEQIKSLVANYDVINIFFAVGGGTSGSALEVADSLTTSKLVLLHPVPLITTDATKGRRVTNKEYSVQAMSKHNHCWIDCSQSNSLKNIVQLVKQRTEDLLTICEFRSLDNNDFRSLFNGSQFQLLVNDCVFKTKTKLQEFLSDPITSFFVGETSQEGNLASAKMLQLLLKTYLASEGNSKVSPKVGIKKQLLTIVCR